MHQLSHMVIPIQAPMLPHTATNVMHPRQHPHVLEITKKVITLAIVELLQCEIIFCAGYGLIITVITVITDRTIICTAVIRIPNTSI